MKTAFTAFFLARARDADKETHGSDMHTGAYRLFPAVARNQKEAVQVDGVFRT